MRPSVIKKEFIREFAKNKKLTVFQKEQLTFLINTIRVDYEIGLRYREYIKRYHTSIEAFINNLDSESKNEVKTIFKNLKFMTTHTLIETVKNFISNGDKILKHLATIETLKKKYKLPLDYYEESTFKYKHGLKFLPNNIIKTLDNKDFIDCGAYIGDTALMFARDYNPNKIYSFEPNLDNYNFFLENIELNNLKNVIPINKGVGEKSCNVDFYSLGPASYIPDEGGNTKIEIISIDEFVSEKNLTVGLIQMDVEGYELKVLKGAARTIKLFKPVLLIEIYHNPEQFFRTKKYIQELMPDYLFEIKRLGGIRPLGKICLIAW